MTRVLTGIQSSGRPHLGNILGAIRPAIALSQQPDTESFFFIADLHSLITVKDGATRQQYVYAIAAAWLAFGFDTEKNVLWRQSRVPAHTELAWYLNCITPFPMLANAVSFKDKSEKMADVNAGLFMYPVLQAADILLYDANFVPVGKDQQQHLEIARDIATTFNRLYGDTLVVPEARIDEQLMTIPGTDGHKMSKSYGNYIDVFLPSTPLRKVVMSIVTDSTPLEAPKNPDTDTTFRLYKLIATPAETEQMRRNYTGGNYGYGHAKQALLEVILREYAKPREIFDYYMNNLPELEQKLRTGEEKARAIAGQVLNRVRTKMGFK